MKVCREVGCIYLSGRSSGLKISCTCSFLIRYQNYVIHVYVCAKECNLEIATKKTKVFGFVGMDHLRTKIIINDETLEQVSQFTYLGCNVSY